VGSHRRDRRPLLSAYLKGAVAPLWILDLNRSKLPKGRKSHYLTAGISDHHVFVYWEGILIKLDKLTGVEVKRSDCSKYGISGAMLDEAAILIPRPGAIIVFHKQTVLCLDESLSRVLWSHHPDLQDNLLSSPVLDNGMLYFFQGHGKGVPAPRH